MTRTSNSATPRGASDVDSRGGVRCAVVTEVDTLAYTVSVRLIGNETIISPVVLGAFGVSPAGPGWMGAMPRTGDQILIVKDPLGDTWFALSSVPYPQAQAREEDLSDEVGDRTQYRRDRPLLFEGDQAMSSSSGASVLVRGGGQVEITASPMCSEVFSRDSHTIRRTCENSITESFAGKAEMWAHREPGRDMEDRTPTGVSLAVKSHAQDAPHIFFDAGFLLENENTPLPGYPVLSSRAAGVGSCVRLMVFEQDQASDAIASGIYPPDPRQARFRWEIDPAGNVLQQSKGHFVEESRDKTLRVTGRYTLETDAVDLRSTQGSTRITARSQISMSAGRGLHMNVRGHSTWRLGSLEVSGEGGVAWRTRGPFDLNTGQGGYRQTVGGNLRLDVEGASSLSFGGSVGSFVGGRDTKIIGGKDQPENTGRDVAGWARRVRSGKALLHASTGSLELHAGPGPIPLAYLRMIQDPLRLGVFTGRVEIGTATGAKLILEPTGAWQVVGLGGVSGSIHADPAGNIQMGPVGAPSGNVVTSLSHRCYVTGLPPMGVPNVTVSSLLPGVPLPGVPVVSPIPAPLLPEEVAFV